MFRNLYINNNNLSCKIIKTNTKSLLIIVINIIFKRRPFYKPPLKTIYFKSFVISDGNIDTPTNNFATQSSSIFAYTEIQEKG